MQRPVMNPNFFEETATASGDRRSPIRFLARLMWRGVRAIINFLRYDPLARLPGFRNEEGTPTSRFIRGLLYRLAFVPVLLAGAACAIVWTSTHPRTVTAEIDPASQGIYYEAITLAGADNLRLEGWLVPVIDAKTVLEEKERVLFTKRPAVVLIHDIGQRREQFLPLIKPLHEAGYVVLAVNLRGGGPHALAGETFGLQESADVKAAVEMLRRRPFVDAKRVALIGYGTGASAAMLAATSDPQIAAVVAERPVFGANEIIKTRIVPQQTWLTWLSPLCKWTFEMSYGVDIDELDMGNFKKLRESRPVLVVESSEAYSDPSDPKIVEQMTAFLASALPPKQALAGAK